MSDALAGLRRAVVEDLVDEAEVSATVAGHHLGQVALAMGCVTPEQLQECVAEQKAAAAEGRPGSLGQILLRRRLLTPGDLVRILGRQQEARGVPSEFTGRYVIVGELGRGAAGVVYRARHKELDAEVALKVMVAHPELPADVLERFRREAHIAGALRHPNIVSVHDAGVDGARHFIAMDLIEGPTLARWLADGARSVRARVAVMEKVTRAVAYANRAGVIHRDLKPGNVIMDAQDEPHVTDFGLARSIGGPIGLTQSGVAMGTPLYMAPEQVRAETRAIDARTDVFALGVMLFEILTGTLPFLGRTASDVFENILRAEPPAPSSLRAGLHRDLDAVCLKALEKERRRRYQTADEFADDLARWLAGEPVRARRTSPVERAARWARRNPLIAAALGTALAGLVGGGTFGVVHLNRARIAAEQLAAEERALRMLYDQMDRVNEAAAAQYYPIADLAAYRAGIEESIRALDQLPPSPRGLHAKGVACLLLHRREDAERALSEAIRLGEDPLAGRAHLERGRIRVWKCFERRLTIRVEGVLIEKLERQRAAEFQESARGALEDLDRAARSTQLGAEAVRRADVLLRFMRYLSEVHGPDGDRQAAERLRAEVRLLCEEAVERGGHVEDYRLVLALLLDEAGDREAAKRHLDEAIRMNPNAAELYCRRGMVRMHMFGPLRDTRPDDPARERAREAIADYTEAIRLDPGHAEAYYDRAFCQSLLKQWWRGLPDLEACVGLRPESPAVHFRHGLALMAAGIVEQRAELRRAALEKVGYFESRHPEHPDLARKLQELLEVMQK